MDCSSSVAVAHGIFFNGMIARLKFDLWSNRGFLSNLHFLNRLFNFVLWFLSACSGVLLFICASLRLSVIYRTFCLFLSCSLAAISSALYLCLCQYTTAFLFLCQHICRICYHVLTFHFADAL